MPYHKATILVPSHSLEDLPTDLGEDPAASLLNAFSVAWHPRLLADTGFLPGWRRADDPPPGPYADQLTLIPLPCDGWLPHGWVDQARADGGTVISELHERHEMLAAMQLDAVDLDADLLADFLALGTCWLQTELLMRHMRNFGNIDEARLQNRAVAAARAALAHDGETARDHLRAAFEIILEARERFYPVECFLLDLCLIVPEQANDHLRKELEQTVPFSLMGTAADWDVICREQPDLREKIREAWARGLIALVGGEERETNLPLLPLNSVLWEFEQGLQTYHSLWDRAPKVWGRRHYGLCAALPQVLSKLGLEAGLHVAFDDGIYPDHEHAKLRWQGSDGTVIDALSRIPLAADTACSFLRFPARMSESMDHDQVAGIVFARWPEVKSPWLEDFRRMANYAPVLGRFVTFEHFFQAGETPGRLATYDSKEYLSPYLIQAVARREADAITGLADHQTRRQEFDALDWCRATERALRNAPLESEAAANAERIIEAAAPPALTAESVAQADEQLSICRREWPQALADLVLSGGGDQPGFLILNTVSFPRVVAVPLPELPSLPKISGPIKGSQTDPATRQTTVLVDLPGSGFVWIAADEQGALSGPPKLPLAEEGLLRNDYFEVLINAETGGIAQIRLHGRRGNRLSQLLSYRFPREKTVRIGPEPDDVEKTNYAQARLKSQRVVSSGPMIGEIETIGEIIDLSESRTLANFRQRIWVHRLRSAVEIEMELMDVQPPEGDPWNNAFVSRFAWNDSLAAITRAVWHGAQPVGGERYESPDYIEIAEEQDRATIIPHGLAFHRKTGPRMLDTLLVVEGETRRTFLFTVAIDQTYPLQATREATVSTLVVPTSQGPPRMGRAGWFYHLDAKHVQILQVLGLKSWPIAESAVETHGSTGFCLRMMETEGRVGQVRLQTFRTPKSARKRDFTGATLTSLPIVEDSVVIDLSAGEIAEIELRF